MVKKTEEIIEKIENEIKEIEEKEELKLNSYEKLLKIQNELKAPKGQRNTFGKYNYRSCEDIIEALKPIALKYNVVFTLNDELQLVGDRFYIKAIAKMIDCDNEKEITTTAFAREEETKKGMDASQITGTASSYARKYALNGLLQIDDTKDADTDAFKKQQEKEEPLASETQIKQIRSLANGNEELIKDFLSNKAKIGKITMLNYRQASALIKEMEEKYEFI